jgi:hypothetical protein
LGDEAAGTATFPRSKKEARETANAIVAIPMAAHAMVCALHRAEVGGSLRAAPHSLHALKPGLIAAPQDRQIATGAPQ